MRDTPCRRWPPRPECWCAVRRREPPAGTCRLPGSGRPGTDRGRVRAHRRPRAPHGRGRRRGDGPDCPSNPDGRRRRRPPRAPGPACVDAGRLPCRTQHPGAGPRHGFARVRARPPYRHRGLGYCGTNTGVARVRRVPGYRAGDRADPVHPRRASTRRGGVDLRAATHRRTSRRHGLVVPHADHRLRADQPGGGRPRHGADGGLDRLRPRPPLRRLPRPLLRPRHHPGDAGGARPGKGRRPHGGAVRPVPRSATRLPVLRERLRRAERRDRERRRGGVAEPQPRRAVERRIGRRRRRERRAERRERERRGLARPGLHGGIRHPRRPLLGRAVRSRRAPRRGRVDGGDGHPVQEPALSVAVREPDAPLGLPDQPQHPGEVRVAGLVPRLHRRRGPADADGGPRRPAGPVEEPEPRVPADLHGPAGRLVRPGLGRLPERRSGRCT